VDVTGTGGLKSQSSDVAGSATATTIDLAKEADKEEFAGFNPAIGKEKQRWYMLFVIGGLFVLLNAAVIWLIFHAIGIDVNFVTANPGLADKRVITSAVFQTLIGATVVQTGAVTWAMARFLFPNQLE
jgi:multisubunit Na+/H+ antiporter MnhB subunit